MPLEFALDTILYSWIQFPQASEGLPEHYPAVRNASRIEGSHHKQLGTGPDASARHIEPNRCPVRANTGVCRLQRALDGGLLADRSRSADYCREAFARPIREHTDRREPRPVFAPPVQRVSLEPRSPATASCLQAPRPRLPPHEKHHATRGCLRSRGAFRPRIPVAREREKNRRDRSRHRHRRPPNPRR